MNPWITLASMTAKPSVLPMRLVALMPLLVLCFGVCPQTSFATSGKVAIAAATVTSFDESGTAKGKFCLGESVTFELNDFRIDVGPIDSIPWRIQYGTTIIPEEAINDYLLLDPAVGTNLDDWNDETSLTFQPLKQGCYTVTVHPFIFYFDAVQDVGEAQVVVADAPAQPTLFGFDDVLMCEGGSVNGGFFSNTVGSVYMKLNHQWSNDSGVILDSLTLGTASPTCDGPSLNGTFSTGNLDAGTYELLVEASNVCGDSSAVVNVEVVRFPEFELSSDPICVEDSAVVTSDFDSTDYAMANGILPSPTALWSDDGTDLGQNTFANPQDGDTFTQTISLLYELTDDDGNVVDNAVCESTSSAVQVVHAPGQIAIVSSGTNEGTSNDMACDGAAVELTVEDVSLSDPAEFYVWDPSTLPSQPGLSGSSIGWESFEVSVSGTVTQTTVWTDGTSCQNNTSFNIEVIEKPEIAWSKGDANVCAGNDAGLIASIEEASTTVVNLVWELEDGTSGNAAIPSGAITIPGIHFSSGGQYPVFVTPTDENGCVGPPIEGLVEVYDNPIAEAIFAETCEGESVVPTDVENAAAFEHEWTLNGSPFSGSGANSASPEFTNVQCGDEVGLTLIQTLAVDGELLVCRSEELVQSIDVVALAMPVVTPTSPLCKGTDINLAFSETANAVGCVALDAIYEWTITAGSAVVVETGLDPVSVPAGTFGAIDIEGQTQSVGSSGLVCPTSQLFSLTIVDTPQIDELLLDVVCRDGDLTIDATVQDPNGGLVYTWVDSSMPQAFEIVHNDASVGEATLSVRPDAAAVSESEVTLNIEDSQGCIASASGMVDIWDPPAAENFTVSDEVLCSGSTLGLTLDGFVTDDELGSGTVDYTWSVTGSNGLAYAATNVGALQDEISTIDIQEVAFADYSGPVAISIVLTMDDGTCTSHETWENHVEVFPNPRVILKPTMMYVSGLIGQAPSPALNHSFGKPTLVPPTVCLEPVDLNGLFHGQSLTNQAQRWSPFLWWHPPTMEPSPAPRFSLLNWTCWTIPW